MGRISEKWITYYSLFFGILFISLYSITIFHTHSTSPTRFHSNLTHSFLALEFSQNITDIRKIIGGPEQENHYVKVENLKQLLQLGYYLLFSYILFFVSLFEFCIRKVKVGFSWKASFVFLLAIAAFLYIIESYKIVSILSSKSSIALKENIYMLKEISFWKWQSVFLATGMMGILLWLLDKYILLRLSGFLFFTSFLLSVVSFFKLNAIENSFLFLFLGTQVILIFLIYKVYIVLKKWLF